MARTQGHLARSISPERMNGNPLPPKKEVALALLERQSVSVHLDPRATGVVVPAWFKRQPQLVLQVGLNMPVPIPLAAIRSAKIQYGKLTGNKISPTKLPPKTPIPAVAIPREPNRSDSDPDRGPAKMNPTVRGSRKIPHQKGVRL